MQVVIVYKQSLWFHYTIPLHRAGRIKMKKILIIIMVCLSAISLLMSIYFVYKSNQVSKEKKRYYTNIYEIENINHLFPGKLKAMKLRIETQNEKMIESYFKKREEAMMNLLKRYYDIIKSREHIYKFYHRAIYFHLVLSVLFLAISLLLMFIPDNKPEKLQTE